MVLVDNANLQANTLCKGRNLMSLWFTTINKEKWQYYQSVNTVLLYCLVLKRSDQNPYNIYCNVCAVN